jgi:hypothetical protein
LEYYDMKCILKSYINFFSFLNKIVIVLFYIVLLLLCYYVFYKHMWICQKKTIDLWEWHAILV